MKKLALLTLTFTLTGALLVGCTSTSTKSDEVVAQEKSASSQEASEGGSVEKTDTTTIDVYNGTMPIPTSYDNFVVLKNNLVEHFTALGVTPKAAAMAAVPTGETDSYSTKYYYDGPARVFANGELDGVEILPTKMTDDLEQILALKPDFIVASDSDEQYLEKLEAIAPTYLIPSGDDTESGEDKWKQQHRLIGKLLGKEEAAEANIAAYEELSAQYKEAAAGIVEGKTALVLQLNSKGFKVRMAAEQSQVYRELGLSIPEGLTEDLASKDVANESGSFPIEMLAPFDPDYIFIDIQSEEDFEALKDTPIWKNLKAVKNNNVMEISHFVWVQSAGPISKTIHLKDVAEFVINGTHVTSNPIIE